MKYFYSLFAPLLLGIHLFSLKHIHNIYEKEKKINGLIIILTLFSFSLALLAKYFVFLDCKNLNNKIFMINTHKEPPKNPVNSYHCTAFGALAKAFPKVSQGQDKSQFKCKYSIVIHKVINAKYPNFFVVAFLTL